jgi:UDP-3-O-[3-hydroxymyristoyl] glucosamine N-acyltransferase
MTLGEIADFLKIELAAQHRHIEISACAKLNEATATDISFLANKTYKQQAAETQAAAIFVSPEYAQMDSPAILLSTKDPYLAFVLMLEKLHPTQHQIGAGINASAVIEPSAEIGENATIGANVYIGENCQIGKNAVIYPNVAILANTRIGDNAVIYPNVSIREDSIIGNHVIIHNGVVIGADGFGFAPDLAAGRLRKIPQIGNVRIGDYVEIGANTCIDRATTGATVIGNGVKIDNLVQVGHNVEIDENTVIAGMTGIAGSTKIGAWSRIGGGCAISGHLNIAPQTTLAGNTGVLSNTESGKIYFGSPAREHKTMMRIEAALGKLPELIKRVRKLEKT